ncbi:MAG: glucosamine-6-phosphate deaminase [Candidatus Hadarchaeum sp.]|uniref:glucosamine-6-phosphate deaminase n=1 Tax=Candidatus Hadarchaeum sp. TaxID=2883567 RepID=UPI00316E6B9F
MQLIVAADYAELSRWGAQFIARKLLQRPTLVLALPTGGTPLGLYQELARFYQERLLDFSQAITFNLDEFLGITPDHPASFRYYMEQNFWCRVNLRPEARHIPQSLPRNPEEECRRYEELLRDAGGLDLALLGLGENGHIAFNEPGTPFESRTHVAELTDRTRWNEALRFRGLEHVPKYAITMGIRTLMNAREILLLVAGAKKAQVLAQALEGPVTPAVPASVLQLHPNLTVLADCAAASLFRT